MVARVVCGPWRCTLGMVRGFFTFKHTAGLNTKNWNYTLDSGHENLRIFVGCQYVECFYVRFEWKSRKMFMRVLRELIEHVLLLLIETLGFVTFTLICVMPIRTVYCGLFVLEAV